MKAGGAAGYNCQPTGCWSLFLHLIHFHLFCWFLFFCACCFFRFWDQNYLVKLDLSHTDLKTHSDPLTIYGARQKYVFSEWLVKNCPSCWQFEWKTLTCLQMLLVSELIRLATSFMTPSNHLPTGFPS